MHVVCMQEVDSLGEASQARDVCSTLGESWECKYYGVRELRLPRDCRGYYCEKCGGPAVCSHGREKYVDEWSSLFLGRTGVLAGDQSVLESLGGWWVWLGVDARSRSRMLPAIACWRAMPG